MIVAHHTALPDLELGIEQGLEKRLAPGRCSAQQPREFQGHIAKRELAIGIHERREGGGIDLRGDHTIEGDREAREVGARQRESGGHGMAAKATQQARVGGGHRI